MGRTSEPDLIIDFSNPMKSDKLRELVGKTIVNGIDLGSGYPPNKVWVYPDGRRIPINAMANDDISSIIDSLRRNIVRDKIDQITAFLTMIGLSREGFPHVPTFEDLGTLSIPQNFASALSEIMNSSNDDYLRSFPLVLSLLDEALERGLVDEDVDIQKPPREWYGLIEAITMKDQKNDRTSNT